MNPYQETFSSKWAFFLRTNFQRLVRIAMSFGGYEFGGNDLRNMSPYSMMADFSEGGYFTCELLNSRYHLLKVCSHQGTRSMKAYSVPSAPLSPLAKGNRLFPCRP